MRSPPVIRNVGGMICRLSSQSAAPSAEGEGRHRPTAAVTTPSVPGRLAGCWLAFLSVLAWLILSAIILRLTTATAAAVFLGAVFLLGASEQVMARAGSGLWLRRKLEGHALAAALALFLTLFLATWHGRSAAVGVLAFVLAVIVVALVGGFVPAVLEAVAGSLLLHFFAVAQPAKFIIGGAGNAAVLGVFVAVAAAVSFGVEDAARRTRQAARAAEAARRLAEAVAFPAG